MIKNILNTDFKYENDKMYRYNNGRKKWSCCNDVKPKTNGYIRIKINKKLYQLHRLVYKYFNEEWDITDISRDNQIDHININPLDNKIENLRILNCSQNTRNQNKRKNCSSKYKGVSWDKQNNKWRADIKINGKSKNLGSFDNEEDAYLAYKKEYDKLMNI
jgi:hypothetical protein